jgi:solute carrier family 9 (sodium/hydrogen exchanger), member 8
MALSDSSSSFLYFLLYFTGKFLIMFFASALIGVLFGILSSLLFKYVDVRKTPSLEMAFMFIFMYAPYTFAEAIKLSGIMAILFAGLVMSHYTHNNLSSITRITIQQTFRTLSFVAETCVFAYWGMAIFSFKHIFKPSLVICSIVLCLASRAVNIFPLSYALNYFREHKITKRMQFIMWFSGLRGAIAFALSLNLNYSNETRHVIVTTTLILVLFTTIVLGGSTLPLMKFLNADKNRRTITTDIFLSKTKEMGEALDENLRNEETNRQETTQVDESSINIQIINGGPNLRGFDRFDEKYLKPFLIRKFTAQELHDGKVQMKNLTQKWIDEVRSTKQQASEAFTKIVFNNKKTKSKINGLDVPSSSILNPQLNSKNENSNESFLLDDDGSESDNYL